MIRFFTAFRWIPCLFLRNLLKACHFHALKTCLLLVHKYLHFLFGIKVSQYYVYVIMWYPLIFSFQLLKELIFRIILGHFCWSVLHLFGDVYKLKDEVNECPSRASLRTPLSSQKATSWAKKRSKMSMLSVTFPS